MFSGNPCCYSFGMPQTHKQVIGKIGEEAVITYLKKRAFSILECNYLKKWGELDIIAWRDDKLHFIEVKSLSRETKGYRAEENVHPRKLQRLARTIQTYLLEKNVPEAVEWQFDVATVLVDESNRLCRVSLLRDLVI